MSPQPIQLPEPSISLSLPPLDPSSSDALVTISLPDPTITPLSLPPLDPSSTGTPTTTPPSGLRSSQPEPTLGPSSPGPSVLTTTVYVYPTDCSPTGTPAPTPSPAGALGDVGALSQDDPDTLPSGTPVTLPGINGTPLVLPPG